METVVSVAATGIAVLCNFLLLSWIISALRGRRLNAGRMIATIVGVCWGIWQVYVLNPGAGTNLTYFMAPIAFVSLLLILSRAVKESMSEPPSEGPNMKIPAMAMRQSLEPGQELGEAEQKKIAVGE